MTLKPSLNRIVQQSWFPIFLGVLLLSLFLGIFQPVFFSYTNFKNILLQSSVITIIAVGMTFVISTGGIDISVAMNLFLVMGTMYALDKIHVPNAYIFLIAIVVSMIVGLLNGILVSIINIPAMIATFATLSICRGLAYILINNQLVTPDPSLRIFGTTMVSFVPLGVIISIIFILIGAFLLSSTKFGRFALAVGDSLVSAQETKIPVHKIIILVYTFCGFCTGMAAFIYLGRLGSIQTDAGYGMEFTVITAVVLGGTTLSGGKGTIIGSFLGCIFLTLIENLLSLLGVSGFYYDVVRGVLLFLSVAVEKVSDYRKERRNLIPAETI